MGVRGRHLGSPHDAAYQIPRIAAAVRCAVGPLV